MHDKYFQIAILSGHPTQWEGPLFGYLQGNSYLNVHVFYETRLGLEAIVEPESGVTVQFNMPGMMDGYAYDFADKEDDLLALFEKWHRQSPFDALIVEGHEGAPQKTGMAWARRRGVPLIYRSDSTLLYTQPLWKRAAKRLLRPSLLRRFSAFLPLSSPAAEYLRHYGVSDERIFLSPYMVDNDWYAREVERWREQCKEIRISLDLARFEKIVLAVLRFEDRENPLEFLAAAEWLKDKAPGVAFVLIGDGNRRQMVYDLVHDRALNNVVLPGYVPLTELPKYYALADVFVHPAREECWGLSVNEAMASGVPVVVSTGVGCRFDLIPSEKYGLVYPLGSVQMLATCIETFLNDTNLAAATVRAAKDRLAVFCYGAAVGAFEEAVKVAAGNKGKVTRP